VGVGAAAASVTALEFAAEPVPRLRVGFALVFGSAFQGGAEVVEGVRFVRDRNVVSAAGVMSGVEMSLWLVAELYGGEVAERTKSYIAYDFPSRTTSEGIIR
jgi:transcriptional regulator GlxA family with amidase domain